MSTCRYLRLFKEGNEASIDNASFGSLLSWFFRFSADVEKAIVACWDGGNDVYYARVSLGYRSALGLQVFGLCQVRVYA